MAKKTAVTIAKYIKKDLSRNIKVDKLIIFGSQQRGNVVEDSDLDLVIISGDFIKKDIFERAILTKDAEINAIKKFMIPLDIITLTPDEFEKSPSLIPEYAKFGKII